MRYLKKLYDWVLHWAETPYGTPALFLLAFAESSFFPVPPDILLMALSLSIPKKAFKYAAVCTIGSVLGGAFGFFLGYQFWEIGKSILFNYVNEADFEAIRHYFQDYEAWAVGIAGFTPIPYKVFTISAGFFRVNFPIFVAASLVSRAYFGPSIKGFIDKYFNLLTFIFFALLILGFMAIKYAF
ncbi:MAG: DedA family protein [Nitrospirae bacterium]|nr:DedA family protein [Nitrospirota bacterium]